MDIRIRPWRRRRWSAFPLLIASILLLLGQSQAKTAADYFVKSLPGQPEGPLLRMHAG